MSMPFFASFCSSDLSRWLRRPSPAALADSNPDHDRRGDHQAHYHYQREPEPALGRSLLGLRDQLAAANPQIDQANIHLAGTLGIKSKQADVLDVVLPGIELMK